MLKIDDVSVVFHPGTQLEKRALDHFNLFVENGDFVTILGSNGAGKSTLFNVISGKTPVSEGKIYLGHEDVTDVKEHIRAKKIGRMFQNPSMGTASDLSVEENMALAYSRTQRGAFSLAVHEKDRQFFAEKLKQLNMGLEDRLKTPIGLLSGGQRQAVALMMAVLNPPEILLLDEHTAALDPSSAQKILEITNELVTKEKITALMITHNIKDALQNGNRLIIMKDGKCINQFNAHEKSAMKSVDVLEYYDY